MFAVPIYFHFFPLAFVSVNYILFSGFSLFLFWKYVRFFFFFFFCCLFLFSFSFLYALVFYVYCRVLPDVFSLMFFHVPPLGFLK